MGRYVAVVLGAGAGVLSGYALPVHVQGALLALAATIAIGAHLLDRGLAQDDQEGL